LPVAWASACLRMLNRALGDPHAVEAGPFGGQRVRHGITQRLTVAGTRELPGQQEHVHADLFLLATVPGRFSSHAARVTG
jgi:hypothetical protein